MVFEYNEWVSDCIFCKIIAGQIPSEKRFEDGEILAFDDVSHDAPVHVPVIPKLHIETTTQAGSELAGKLMQTAEELAKKLYMTYYQAFMNGGSYREVAHLHYHLKGGVK